MSISVLLVRRVNRRTKENLIPRTSALGAVLLTGFLGGAIATHFRVEDPLFGYTLFPVYVGAIAWAGLLLRDVRLRVLVPGR